MGPPFQPTSFGETLKTFPLEEKKNFGKKSINRGSSDRAFPLVRTTV